MNFGNEDEDDVTSATTQPITGEIRALAPMEAAMIDRASIDSQIATAKAYPRSVTAALREAKTLATLDEATAASMSYALERKENGKKKTIPGPSVRLAEVMVYAWTNLRVDAEIVGDDRTHITARGTCFDLEKNIATRVAVRRRITNKSGARYGDDMIGVTGNAAVSIAFRNSVFKTIPRAYVERVWAHARQAALGEGTMVDHRRNALAWYAGVGMKAEQVYALLGVKGNDDIGEDEIIVLKAYRQEVVNGETTIAKLIRKSEETGDESEGAANLNATLGAKKADAAPPSDAQIQQDDLELLRTEDARK